MKCDECKKDVREWYEIVHTHCEIKSIGRDSYLSKNSKSMVILCVRCSK